MFDADPAGDEGHLSRQVMESELQSRVVIDFSVGPPGVGPPTSVTPRVRRESTTQQPPPVEP
jgi:hypothetical protein